MNPFLGISGFPTQSVLENKSGRNRKLTKHIIYLKLILEDLPTHVTDQRRHQEMMKPGHQK